jgi:hypothetical protein
MGRIAFAQRRVLLASLLHFALPVGAMFCVLFFWLFAAESLAGPLLFMAAAQAEAALCRAAALGQYRLTDSALPGTASGMRSAN